MNDPDLPLIGMRLGSSYTAYFCRTCGEYVVGTSLTEQEKKQIEEECSGWGAGEFMIATFVIIILTFVGVGIYYSLKIQEEERQQRQREMEIYERYHNSTN